MDSIADYCRSKHENSEVPKLNFICTHNSRRSQLAQVWAAVASGYYHLENIKCYSGGTEVTAFNPRAVGTLERAGLNISKHGNENPVYTITVSEVELITCFSKVYDDPVNPAKDFAAVMTCSDADQNCPIIPGCELRIPLTYVDPKVSDDTSEEVATYDDRCRQISREMLLLMKKISDQRLAVPI